MDYRMDERKTLFFRAIMFGTIAYFIIPLLVKPLIITDAANVISDLIWKTLGVELIGAAFSVFFIDFYFRAKDRSEWDSNYYGLPLIIMGLTALGVILFLFGRAIGGFSSEFIIGIGQQILGGILLAALSWGLNL
jgi:hypothetical protein